MIQTETNASAIILDFPLHRSRDYRNATALDICLARCHITAEQHWCGMHLLWLHKIMNFETVQEVRDEEWRNARLLEYKAATTVLSASGLMIELQKVCIYGHMPSDLKSLQFGLDILVECWRVPS